ncbi:MAG: hypothetical protein H0W12_06655 [Chitinophagaceae bacterium]|nr:hypothetical protein [Chitinophagaceae bacterium]
MLKILSSFLLFIFFFNVSFAQRISPDEFRSIRKKEDSLKVYALQIIQGNTDADRFIADSQFTKILVRALRINNSFYYPFDSLITISKLVPNDSTFKIFTWQLLVNENITRQHGAIQMRTNDGSLKLLPLIDKSDVVINMADTVANNFGWIGAVYYKLIEKQAFGKNYYTLLGYDENNMRSTKKIVDVLTFNNGEPIFGGSYFSVPDNSISKSFGARFILEYKKDAGPRLTYDKDMDMIVYEHLISETNEPKKKYTYIPDGDYEGLQWKNGKWVHIEKVYTFKVKEGEEPVPAPIRNSNGDIDETKLKDNNPTTTEDAPIEPDVKKTTPAKKKIKK